MSFNTKDCEWKGVRLVILGYKLSGLRGFEVSEELEKEYVYGSDNSPIDIAWGNESYPISFSVLKYELDALNDVAQAAGYKNIMHVPHHLIQAYIEFVPKGGNGKLRFINVPAFEFTSLKLAMKQGDKMMEVPLPGLAMDVISGFV